MCGCDPYNKYPKNGGLALFVGLEWKHMSLLYHNMFCEGAFKIIKDEHTRLYRSVRYDRNDPTKLEEYDEAYREQWKDAPPLVPPRMIRLISWNDHNLDQPKRIFLTNGWDSLWATAEGEPDQGKHYSLVRFDEEMNNPVFYAEAHRGMTRTYETERHRPKGIWSATSQVANVELAELRDKATADPDSDFVQQFSFTIDANPYIPRSAKNDFKAGLSEEDIQTRYYGFASSETRRMYKRYNAMGNSDDGTGHGCEPFQVDLLKFTRYVFLDPSVTHCATLVIAIDELEQYKTVIGGFDIQGATARMWAKELKEREDGMMFECCFIDERMGNESLAAREKTTVAKEYAAAFKEIGLQFRQHGSLEGFFPACADREARIIALNSAMEVRGSGPFEGTCQLRVFRGVLPELDKQIRRAQTDPKNPKKWLKNPKIPQDFLEDLEYAAAANLRYTEPKKVILPKLATVADHWKERQKLKRKREAMERTCATYE